MGLSEFGVGMEGRSGGVATRAERMRSAESEESSGREECLGARMLRTRTVLVSGQVDDKLAEKTIAQLLILDAESHDPIRVMITSQGGHVDSGFAIHDVLRFIDSPVVTIGAGWVASIAVPILFGAPKERRYSLPHTRFLLHQPSGGAGGSCCTGALWKRKRRPGISCAEPWTHRLSSTASSSPRAALAASGLSKRRVWISPSWRARGARVRRTRRTSSG